MIFLQEDAASGKDESSLCRVSNAMIAVMQSTQRSQGRMDVAEMMGSVRRGDRDDVSERDV